MTLVVLAFAAVALGVEVLRWELRPEARRLRMIRRIGPVRKR